MCSKLGGPEFLHSTGRNSWGKGAASRAPLPRVQQFAGLAYATSDSTEMIKKLNFFICRAIKQLLETNP